MKKIFIIHGWTYSTGAWDALTLELRKNGFEPIMLRVPGLTEVSEKIWTLPEYVNWLSGKLNGESEIILLGHSNGGRIALAFAAESPAALSKLILIDSAGVFHNEPLLRLKRRVFGSIAKVGKKLTSSPLIRKIFYKMIGARDYERAPKNMQKTMKNLISIDLTAQFSKIKVPTLILWGAKDKATPVSDAELMHQEISSSKLIVISGAAHSPHITHPARVAEEIKNFLQ